MSPRKTPDSTSPFTLGENVAVKMSQRTLLVILGVVVTATLAWTNLKSGQAKNMDAIAELTAARKSDHDLLMRVANGVDRLERRADREDRRSAATPNRTRPDGS